MFIQITDLKPDTSYVFVVRAENSQGISVPSEMSEEAHTQGTHLRDVPIHQINEARSRLATKVILLKNLTPTSSTTVKITWEVCILFLSFDELRPSLMCALIVRQIKIIYLSESL